MRLRREAGEKKRDREDITDHWTWSCQMEADDIRRPHPHPPRSIHSYAASHQGERKHAPDEEAHEGVPTLPGSAVPGWLVKTPPAPTKQ